MKLVQALYESPKLASDELTDTLRALYDGGLGFARPRVVTNFVTSVDGVAAIRSRASSPSLISRSSPADRFVMGLLRAFASAVLIGAGTLRDEPRHRWTPGHVFPQCDPDFKKLRQKLGLSPEPKLVVLTASGSLDPSLPSLKGALIVTNRTTKPRLEQTLPASEVAAFSDDGRLDLSNVLAGLRERGHELVLCEGGPLLMGELVKEQLVDELFLTISPLLLGRLSLLERPALMAGVELPADASARLELLSVRRSDSHLLLRYGFAAVIE